MATKIIDEVNRYLHVVTISNLANAEWSDIINTHGAVSVFITVSGADVDMFLPSWNTGTDQWETDGTNARDLENLIATNTAGQLKMADGTTYAGYVPGNVMPPRMQFYNGNASARSVVIYISYPVPSA